MRLIFSSVNLNYQQVIHYPNLSAFHVFDLALQPLSVHGNANHMAALHLAILGDIFDEEGYPVNLLGIRWWIDAHTLLPV